MGNLVKFDRRYELTIQATSTGDGSIPADIVVKLPSTLEIQVSRNVLSSVNNGSFRIYNLNPKHRESIRKDSLEYSLYKRVVLKSGYGEDLDVIFAGNVLSAYSVREGTNFVTTIEAFDGGFAITNTTLKQTSGRNQSYSTIVDEMIVAFKENGVKKGTVGAIKGKSGRGTSFSGNAFDQINALTGNSAFIDNETLNILGESEYLGDDTILLSKSSGLLGTPKIEGGRISVPMLFEPKILVGQRVQIISSTNKQVDGKFYKVLGLKHAGIFSDSVGGKMETTLDLFYGIGGLVRV